MVDIFDEVEEELRAERAQQMLRRYGGLIVALIVLIIGAAGGWQGWRWYEARRDQAAAVEYLTAMNLAEAPAAGATAASRTAAAAAFAVVASSAPEGYATLARLREAALKADAGEVGDAVLLWDRVAGDASADPLLRDLATLMWAEHQIDTADPALLEARLKPLAAPTNAWRTLADEQLALLDIRQGKTEQARTTLQRLAADAAAPSGVRGRAGALLARMGG
ncbi:MAG: tetratricopeptide repeat protein [Acetobacteraceae bacterium]